MVNMHIPFVNLSRFFLKHRDQILELTDKIGQSGVYILGDEVEEFERDFADFCGAGHAISVGNGFIFFRNWVCVTKFALAPNSFPTQIAARHLILS